MPELIAIIGGTGSGKSTLAKIIQQTLNSLLGDGSCTAINADMFYRDISAVNLIQGEDRNWDSPDLIAYEAILHVLDELCAGNSIHIPYYNKESGKLIFDERQKLVAPANIIIAEGFLFHAAAYSTGTYLKQGKIITHYENEIEVMPGQEVLPDRIEIYERLFGKEGYFSSKYFVACPQEEALYRRLRRDYILHNRPLETTLTMWQENIWPTHEKLIAPAADHFTIIDNCNFPTNTIAELVLSLANRQGKKYTREHAISVTDKVKADVFQGFESELLQAGQEKYVSFPQEYQALLATHPDLPILKHP